MSPQRRSAQESGELYFQSGVMIIVFIVHSLADSLMNFPSHYFRGTAEKLILMKLKRAVQANTFFILQTSSVIVWLPHMTHKNYVSWTWELSHLDLVFFYRLNYSVFGSTAEQELKMVNNLQVAPCVPALNRTVCVHTTPCHSLVSGSVTTTHSPTHDWCGATKSSIKCVYFKHLKLQIYSLSNGNLVNAAFGACDSGKPSSGRVEIEKMLTKRRNLCWFKLYFCWTL